jgi:hypothetical protein
VIEVQLEPDISPREQLRRLTKVRAKIEYWQHTAEKAARSHKKKRYQKLRSLGIKVSRLPKCYAVF